MTTPFRKQSRWPLAVCWIIVLAVVAAQQDLWPIASAWAGTALKWTLGLLACYAPFHLLLGIRNGTIEVGEYDGFEDHGHNVNGMRMVSRTLDASGAPRGLDR